MGPEQIMWWPCAGRRTSTRNMFAVIIIFVFLFAGRRGGCWFPWSGPGRYHGGGESDSAVDILKKRYAKGEITKDEFEQMNKDILS